MRLACDNRKNGSSDDIAAMTELSSYEMSSRRNAKCFLTVWQSVMEKYLQIRSGKCVKLKNGATWVDTSVHRQILLGCGFWVVFLFKTNKEKHSLTRKLVGYWNWRQRWCKKEGNKVLGKDK